MANTEDVKVAGQGVSFAQLLTVLFVALKLTHVISWSWWWVLLPLWGGLAFLAVIVALIVVGCVIGLGIAALIKVAADSKRRKRLDKANKVITLNL